MSYPLSNVPNRTPNIADQIPSQTPSLLFLTPHKQNANFCFSRRSQNLSHFVFEAYEHVLQEVYGKKMLTWSQQPSILPTCKELKVNFVLISKGPSKWSNYMCLAFLKPKCLGLKQLSRRASLICVAVYASTIKSPTPVKKSFACNAMLWKFLNQNPTTSRLQTSQTKFQRAGGMRGAIE